MVVRCVGMFACFFTILVTGLCASDVSKLVVKPNVETHRMGGVNVPSAATLKKMHGSQYVLRAAGGKITKIPVLRKLLPHSDEMNPQGVQVDIGPKGTIYVRQLKVLCKSIDGGRSWTSKPINLPAELQLGFRWKILRDGTFISVGCATGSVVKEPATVWASKDEGVTWEKRAEIAIDNLPLSSGNPYVQRYVHRGLNRLRDDTLIWGIDVRDNPYTKGMVLYFFQSTDGGKTWEGPTLVNDRGASEGGTVRLPSGRLFATMRLGIMVHPSDPPLLLKYTRKVDIPPFNGRHRIKNLFVMDSDDNGKTWNTPRLLTTTFGQTFGYPAVQSDGTVVVIHDTRYGPGSPGSRAMISRDEGKTWEDEVYYLDSTTFTGSYTASVVLDDDTILTIAGSSQTGNSWEAVKNHTDFFSIRWKPVKD
jgi:BNR repeat-like domain